MTFYLYNKQQNFKYYIDLLYNIIYNILTKVRRKKYVKNAHSDRRRQACKGRPL